MTGPDDAHWAAEGKKLFSGTCDFIMGAAQVEQLPAANMPEVAFAGRSNVGKSSLLNAVTGRKSLARTSGTPGHTRQVNFFNLNGKLMLVDLPGYGYAKASKKEIKGWNHLIFDYLRGRVPLKRVMLLIDSRHGLKPNDEEMMRFLDDLAVPYQIILTKCDKGNKHDSEQQIADTMPLLKHHPAALNAVLSTSASKGYGIQELRAEMARLASQ
jgi:GTP-binding protein